MFNVTEVKARFGEHEITLQTGKMARQASGAVLVSCLDARVLVTAVAGPHRAEAYFFPLVVDYIEKTYAAGKIPGGFLKREGRLNDDEVLTSRLIDRPIRPLFPEGYKGDTQIMCTVLSFDARVETNLLAMLGASAALTISPAPFSGPIAGVRVGRLDGKFIANPSFEQGARCDINIVMACGHDAIMMVEGEANEATEAEILAALDFGQNAVRGLLAAQDELGALCGKPKMTFVAAAPSPAFVSALAAFATQPIIEAMAIRAKAERYAAIKAAKVAAQAALLEAYPADISFLANAFEELQSSIMREAILAEGKRLDGRGLRDIRQIETEVGILPRVHGSALFTRGETQGLVTTTLGTDRDAKLIDDLQGKRDERFMLHYNFPPFSVGEVKPLRGPGRREIGHGFLAHRALQKVLPSYEDFPYVIRLVSEILESNGSSSMATVCGGSMALMDAGVPIKAPVAGIAMGLIYDGKRAAVLSDILGDEDHLGDMDFKVAGTAKGITSVQMDIKIQGLSRDIMASALDQAREGRLHILSRMAPSITESRDDISAWAPRVRTIQVPQDRIRDVIGAGGKTIRSIQERTGCSVDIQDDGTVKIASNDIKKSDEAIAIVRALTASPTVGTVYLGTVAKITEFGAFVNILPNVDGLVHVSEISEERVERVEDYLREGDEIIVKCIAIEGNRFKLSRKEALGQRPTGGTPRV